MAPGMTRTIALSTISMTVIESVSAASAIVTASRRGMPPRSRGTNVNE
jgi:hypothetical protein